MAASVHITLVVDKSGSMQSQKADVIGGFNAFLEAQRETPGRLTVTLVQFDSTYTLVHDGVPVECVPDLNAKTYQPGGGTALVDAIARGIADTERFIRGLAPQDRPARVVFVVMTDGEDNKSHWYDLEDLRALITHHERGGAWQFMYIGQAFAGLSHREQATSLGIRNASTTDCTSEAYRDVTEVTSVVRARVQRDEALRWRGGDDETN